MPRKHKLATRKRAVVAPTPPPPASVSPRVRWLCAAGVFAAVLVVYLFTIIPTVVDQDSGELVSAAHVLGIAHPTGYPFWTLLGHLFDVLPLGHTSAYRVALLSAVSAAAAAGVITWLTIGLSGSLAAGLFAGLSFGLWFPVWSQAVLAEVYALEALLFTLCMAAMWKWDRERTPRNLCLVCLAGGFAAMQHRTAFLAAFPAMAAAAWLTRPRRARVWLAAALSAVAPFAWYLYLPLRAAAHPSVNWGNPNTLDRFFAHLMGSQYHVYLLKASFDGALEEAQRLMGEVLAGPGAASAVLALVSVPLTVWGIAGWVKRRPVPTLSLLAGSLLLCGWVLSWSDTSDSKVWLSPLGAVAALFGGLGLARLSAAWPKRKLGAVLAATAGAAVCMLLVTSHWKEADRRDLWRYHDQWQAALSRVERNAILISDSDNPTNAVMYLQQVEGRRKDVTLINPNALWTDWYPMVFADPGLAKKSQELWRRITAEKNLKISEGAEWGQCVALFARELAEEYRGRRPVYALHGPLTENLPAPPFFVSVYQDLLKVDFTLPDPVRAEENTSPRVEFPNGARLMTFSLGGKVGRPGEFVDYRLQWETRDMLMGWIFALRLRPVARGHGERLEDNGYFLQEFKPVYGMWGLPPSPPGRVYEQTGKLFIPNNAPPGQYTLEMGIGQRSPEYGEWTPVTGAGELVIEAGARSNNR